jgi:hypothetical protein
MRMLTFIRTTRPRKSRVFTRHDGTAGDGLPTSLKPRRPVPANLVLSLLDSMQDACSAFKFVTSPCWVRGTFPQLHCARRLSRSIGM